MSGKGRMGLVFAALASLFVANSQANAFYDPQQGRFISRDPIAYEGGSPNLYSYTNSMPLVGTDPMGLEVKLNCYNPGGWVGFGREYGLTAGDAMNPDQTKNAIIFTVLFQMLASTPTSGEDLVKDTVTELVKGQDPDGNYPEEAVAAAFLLQKIMQQRAFMWVKVQCAKCECDDPEDTVGTLNDKHVVWHRCTFPDIDTRGNPRLPPLDHPTVGLVRNLLGLIPMNQLKGEDLSVLRSACQLEAYYKADEICGNKK